MKKKKKIITSSQIHLDKNCVISVYSVNAGQWMSDKIPVVFLEITKETGVCRVCYLLKECWEYCGQKRK